MAELFNIILAISTYLSLLTVGYSLNRFKMQDFYRPRFKRFKSVPTNLTRAPLRGCPIKKPWDMEGSLLCFSYLGSFKSPCWERQLEFVHTHTLSLSFLTHTHTHTHTYIHTHTHTHAHTIHKLGTEIKKGLN